MGDFFSTAQKHNAQFLEHNSLMPTYGAQILNIVFEHQEVVKFE